MGEHHIDTVGVRSSILLVPTISKAADPLRGFSFFSVRVRVLGIGGVIVGVLDLGMDVRMHVLADDG